MTPEFIEDRLAGPWIEPGDKALQAVADATVETLGVKVRNFLHGTWLGHPLHPAVVTVPLGAFTTVAVLDVLGEVFGTDDYEPGADAAVALGLASSTLAAASGLADWSRSNGEARRVGVLHAALNGSATLCYLASWFLRRNDQRQAGVGTGLAGFALMMGGAFLGGNMAYNHKLGVDSAKRTGPEVFTAVIPERELLENSACRVELDGVGILIVKQHGQVFAMGEKCAHLGGPLAQGKVGENTITCPWHGSKFRLSDGQVLEGPSAYSQPCFETRLREGQVEVRMHKRN